MINGNRTLKPESIDIERMAEECDIRLHVIQRAFDLPITCEAEWQEILDASNSIDEIKAIYLAASVDSPAEIAGLTKWIELAITSHEIKEAYDHTDSGSAAEAAVIRKLATFFTRKP